MTVELRPLGVKCNIQCQYCYQNPIKDAGNVIHDYDIEQLKAAVEKEGSSFTLFGGEPLIIPVRDLEKLWSWGFQRFGSNGIQTNGTLIETEHIKLFKKYKVGVGISVDGPGELNDVRWQGDLERTRAATAKTHKAIERLCEEGIPPSLIVTLHRNNATSDKLPRMHEWFRHLDQIGVPMARLHLLEVDTPSIRKKYSLTDRENIEALQSFAELERNLNRLKFDLFEDMRNMLSANDNRSTCIWNACDPYTTAAVRGIEGNGQSSNCGRTNKDGIDFTKSDLVGFERYLALYQTPQQYNGCKDCRFFLACKGQCPGTSIDGDWRNRTEHCNVWKALLRQIEEEMLDQGQIPISANPLRREVERHFLVTWSSGSNTSIATALAQVEKNHNGNTTSNGNGKVNQGNGNRIDHRAKPTWIGEENSAHGDLHGDHTDSHSDQ